jgi:hypothetical protein
MTTTKITIALLITLILCIDAQSSKATDNAYINDITRQITEASRDKKENRRIRKTTRLLARRAEAYAEAGKISLAEQDYFEAIKTGNFGWTWVDLANFYGEQKLHEKAQKCIDKIDRDFPHHRKEIAFLRKYMETHQRIDDLEKDIPEIVFNTAAKPRKRIQYNFVRTPLPSYAPRQHSSSIYTDCKKEWKTDYEMVEYCVKEQTKAKNWVSDLSNNGIRQRCEKQWKRDYEMIEWCIDEQTKAKNSLSSIKYK